MVRVGVSLGEDDILYNRTNLETMEKSSTSVPFKGGQEMHVFVLRALIDLCNLANSCVVNMNSSTGMCELLVFSSSNHILCSLKILIFVALIVLQGITFKLVSLLATIPFFVLEPNDDYYEKVVKPLLEQVELQVEPSLIALKPLDSPVERECE